MSDSKVSKVGLQHYLIFLLILGGVTFYVQAFLVDAMVQGFILSQFKPEKGELELFDGVWATPSKNGIEYIEQNGGVGPELKKEYINREFYFDFTGKAREEKVHGYKKGATEWLVRAPKLGEEAIILEPYGFIVLSFIVGTLLAILITIWLPPNMGYISQKVEREIANTKAKIRLQTGFNSEIVEILTLRDNDLERINGENPQYIRQAFKTVWDRTVPEEEKQDNSNGSSFNKSFETDEDVVRFRNQILYGRIKEVISEVIVTEIYDIKSARKWQRNRLHVFAGLRLYMAHHFSHKYANNVTGFAYGGAAFLIIAVGIRGLKFIPGTRPSLIFFAILLEFTMLSLLAITLFYTEEEERVDKMLKKMEDASKNQLEKLNTLAGDMHKMAIAFEGGTSELMKRKVEEAVGEYLRSDDNVESAVAHAIRDKIVISLNESLSNPNNTVKN